MDNFRAIFQNKETLQLFSSEEYNEEIGYFITDTLESSDNKLIVLSIISNEDYLKEYTEYKYIPKISLNLIRTKKEELNYMLSLMENDRLNPFLV